jgi:hypothetical protein
MSALEGDLSEDELYVNARQPPLSHLSTQPWAFTF